MNKSKWLNLLKLLAPIVLTQVKPELAPIADEITEAIASAEQLHGSNGANKLKHVQDIADNAADVINTAKGKIVVDKTDLHDVIAHGVGTVVSTVNMVDKAKVK